MFALSTVTSIKAASVNTPPLSPGSGTASLSPHSPYSQKSPTLNGPPSPNGRMSPAFAPTLPAAGASPISPHGFQERVTSPPDLSAESPDEDLDDAVSPRIPFFEKIKDKLPNLDTTTAAKSTEPSPVSPTDSDSEYGGLAYADSDGDEDDEDGTLRSSPQPLPAAKPAEPPASSSSQQPPPQSQVQQPQGKVRFPSMTNTESRYSSSSSSTMDTPKAMKRSLSASTVRTVAKSTGAIDRAMETLLEDGDPFSPTASAASLPAPFAERDRDSQRDSVTKSPKLPTRSHTSPTLPSGRGSGAEQRRSGASKRPRVRVCVRCEQKIDDGRWIAMEGGSVLCDRCWKNMYLPKVSLLFLRSPSPLRSSPRIYAPRMPRTASVPAGAARGASRTAES